MRGHTTTTSPPKKMKGHTINSATKMRYLRTLLALLLTLLLTGQAWGQGERQRHSLPNRTQLPVANVHRLLQDADGYMWYATMGGGLCRDNGYRIDVFRPSQLGSDIPQQSNNVECISLATDGRVWMGTRSGLYFVDNTDYRVHEPNASLRGEYIYALCCMQDGTLWIALHDAFLHLDAEGQRLGSYEVKDSLGHSVTARHLIENSKGELMGCGTWNVGLLRYNTRSDAMEILPWGIEGSPQYMIEDRSNHCYWVCTWGRGVVKYKDGKAEEQPLYWLSTADAANQGLALTLDRTPDGTLWVSTMESLHAYSTQGGTLRPLTTPACLPRQLMVIDGVRVDRGGNVWVGGFTPGTFILSPPTPEIRRDSLPTATHKLGMPIMPERMCHSDDGGTWFYQSRRGMVYADRAGDKVYHNAGGRLKSMSNIFCRHAGGRGIWVAIHKDVDHVWHEQGEWQRGESIPVRDDINDVADDGHGHLWIAGRHTLQRYGIASQTLKEITHEWGSIKALCCATDGSLYCIADSSGILHVDRHDKVTLLLRGRNFSALTESARQTLYAATSDGRVLQRPKGADAFSEDTLLGSNDGQAILAILTDSLDHVWTMTNQRVKESNPQGGTSRTFNCHDEEFGLDFFLSITYEDGKVWLSGPSAIVSVSPNEAMDKPALMVSPRIATAEWNGLRHVLGSHSQALTLPADARNISFEFTTLDYLHAKRTQYRYRLQGYQKEWVTLNEGENTAFFERLPSGHYTLEVKATDRYGSWSTDTATLSLQRMPAWWETWWLRTLALVLLAALLLLAVYLWHHKQMRRRQLQMEQRLTEMKFQFFTNVSHELRTPLTLISTPLDAAMQRLHALDEADADTTSYIKKKLQGACLHANELSALIDKLLDFRKLEMKEQTLHLSNGDVTAFLRSAVESFRPLAEKKGIALGVVVPQGALYMNFDADKLHHIMGNLLSNAVKFSQRGGSIVATVSQLPHKMLEITVADTGAGIAPDDLPHIFERYYQARHTQGGTGIGLQLVETFCKMHGGSVTVESRLGHGSTFTVLIPTDLTTTHQTPDTAASRKPDSKDTIGTAHGDATGDAPNPAQQEHRPCLLVVDDNAELRDMLADEFLHSYRILQAANGQEALDVLRGEEVDLVVSDVMMPVMDGYALCEAIRSDISISHTLVILLTAKTAEESKIQGFRSGADAYLSKPFNMQMLKVRMETLLRQRSERHHAFQHQAELPIEEAATDDLDREFLQQAMAAVERHLCEEAYSVEDFSADLAMSKSTLYRKLGSISGQKPKEFIRTIRLRHAAGLLKSGRHTVSEVAALTGFSYTSYFCKCFKEMYGVQPGNYK